MGSHAHSVDDVLSESLSFNFRVGVYCATDRKSITFHPSGGGSYSSACGIRVMELPCNYVGWMGPSTAKLFMEVHNTITAAGEVLNTLFTHAHVCSEGCVCFAIVLQHFFECCLC